MNNVSLIGRLTRDPELRGMPEGRSVCDLRVAVDNGKGKNGEHRDPTYVDVSVFDGAATACAEHLRKGRRVGVSGRLLYREWEAEDGSRRSRHSVIGRVEFLDAPSANGQAAETESQAKPAAVGAADEEIAF